MYTLAPNHCIEGFEGFCGKKNCGTKTTYVEREVPDNVKLWFVKPTWSPLDRAQQEV